MLARFLSRPTRPDPFAVTVGAIQALIEAATERRDMTAVGRLNDAMATINRECMKAGK